MRTLIRPLGAAGALYALTPASSALGKVAAKPDASGLPGSDQLEQLVNGLFFWALLASLAGLFISIATYAVANRMGNHHHPRTARSGSCSWARSPGSRPPAPRSSTSSPTSASRSGSRSDA
jgi:hypothetical protein